MFGFENHNWSRLKTVAVFFPQFFYCNYEANEKIAENPMNDFESGKLQKSAFGCPAKCTGVCFLKNNLTISCAHNWRKNEV
jgi:hypothetical protein